MKFIRADNKLMDFRRNSFSNWEFGAADRRDSKFFEAATFDRRESVSMRFPFGERRDSFNFDNTFFERRESIFSEANAFGGADAVPTPRDEEAEDLVKAFDLSPETFLGLRKISKFRSSQTLLTPVNESSHSEEATKLFFSNIVIASKIAKLTQENEELRSQLKLVSKPKTPAEKPKRSRRTKDQINRKFSCSVENCGKAFG